MERQFAKMDKRMRHLERSVARHVAPLVHTEDHDGVREIQVRAPPHTTSDQVRVRVRPGMLVVSGGRENASVADAQGFHAESASAGAWSQSQSIPHWIRGADVQATFDDATHTLTLTFPLTRPLQ